MQNSLDIDGADNAICYDVKILNFDFDLDHRDVHSFC